MSFEEYWNETHKKYFTGKVIYDNWLVKYNNILSKCRTSILDLGCGEGNDTLYLIEKGYKVISLDYSKESLNIVSNNIKESKVILADISSKLPFDDNSFDIIVADLSLHYFNLETTKQIMLEIKRILTKNGALLARVNSLNDLNFGAQMGQKIEEDYYFVSGYNKRFFSTKTANEIFSIIGPTKVIESDMLRYSKLKKVIEIYTKVSK